MKRKTTGRDIFDQLEISNKKFDKSVNKLYGLATDGMAVMTAKNKRVFSLFKQKIGEETFLFIICLPLHYSSRN